jgi:hypothetical protein
MCNLVDEPKPKIQFKPRSKSAPTKPSLNAPPVNVLEKSSMKTTTVVAAVQRVSTVQSAMSSKSNTTPQFVTTNSFSENIQHSKPIRDSNIVRVASILKSESSSDSMFFFVFYLHKLNRIMKYFYSRRR